MALAYSNSVEKVRNTLVPRMKSLIKFYEAMEHEALGALKATPDSLKQKIKLQVSTRSLNTLNAVADQVASATVDFSQLPDRIRVETINLMVPIIDKTLMGMEGMKNVYELLNGPVSSSK